MAHPFNDVRQTKVEHSRAGNLTRGYASGGRVHDSPVAGKGLQRKVYNEEDGQAVVGAERKERMDRPGRSMRARGGRTNKKGHTTVNVIMAPHGGAPAPATSPPVAGGPAAPPLAVGPRPPMAGPAPMPMGGPPMAGGLPPRQAGGRTYARGGGVKSGPAWDGMMKAVTPVQHNESGKNDQHDVSRGKPITYAKGGRIYSPEKAGVLTPHLPGGSGGGKARLVKEKRAARMYAKAK